MHKFRFHLSRIIRADFDPHRLDILFVSRYLTNPSEDCPIVSSSLGHSIDCSLDRSIARSIVRSLGRSFGRSIARSVALSIVRSFSQSISPPPSLPLPVSIPRFPYPFPCISHPSPSPSGFVDWNKTFISHSILVLGGVLICFGVLGVCEDAHGIEGSVLNRGGFQLNSGALESTFRVTTSVRGDEGSRR